MADTNYPTRVVIEECNFTYCGKGKGHEGEHDDALEIHSCWPGVIPNGKGGYTWVRCVNTAHAEGREAWIYGHNHPNPTEGPDYFHNYGDCGGNLMDGCGFKKEKDAKRQSDNG